MRRLVILGVALTAAANAAPAPDYSSRNNIYSSTQLTPVPHARFMNVEAMRQYKECIAQGRENCQNYEFTAPYSLDSETVNVATKLRAAWQRLEDRYYWRAMTRLNNPAMVVSHCSLDWKNGQKAQAAKLVVNVENNMFPQELAGKVPQQQPDDRLHMDSYGLLPQVPNTDYCEGLNLEIAIMYLPGTCIYLGSAKLFCIEGNTPSLNPLAPRPLNFRNDLAVQRVKQAIQDAQTTYLKEYAQDVMKALAPSAKFFPLPWSGLDGAVVAPAMSRGPDLAFLKNNSQEAANNLGGIFQATTYPYYLQGLSGPSLALRAHLLPKQGDVLGVPNPPGVWKLEEFKRRFPINNPMMYERFGYTNLFQSWSEVKPRLLPEAVNVKPLRQMIYMASGGNIYLPNTVPVPMPAPMLIEPFVAGLPYTGPKTRFAWVSVAEGYGVPRVQGNPLGYGGVTK
jgi:hypothetical protein